MKISSKWDGVFEIETVPLIETRLYLYHRLCLVTYIEVQLLDSIVVALLASPGNNGIDCATDVFVQFSALGCGFLQKYTA